MKVITPWSGSGRDPFAIISPLAPSRLQGGAEQTVEWDVANTTADPINCASVDVAISTDNGLTFTDLATNTTNDGRKTVTLPNAVSTDKNFLRVKCSNNIFFALSKALSGDPTAPPLDTTPDAFSFAAQTNVTLSTVVTSASITVSGINAAAPISVTGGKYSINGGAFTSTAGTVTNGATVRIQHTASAAYETKVDTTLSIGGVNGTFSSTTKAEDVQQDTTPDAFSFGAKTGVERSTVMTSDSITVSGINAPAPISVSGGKYSINGGAFTSASGTVTNGATVRVQHTSSAEYQTQVDTLLRIGDVQGYFTSKTSRAPAVMAFVEQTDVQPSSVITSNVMTVSGLDAPVTLRISGGEYSKNGGNFSKSSTTVQNGDTVQVRHTSSSRSTIAVTTTVSLGTQTLTFKSTTLLIDSKPDAFGFNALTEVMPSSLQESSPVTLAGMNVASAISVSGGEYSINGAAYTKRSGTVKTGDTVRVRHTSSSSSAKTVKTTLTVGGVKGEFSSKTVVIDDKPDTFSFETKDPVDTSSQISSETVTISGINVPVAISVSNGEYRINGGEFTWQKGTIKAGDTLQLRHTSSSRSNRIVTTSVTVGSSKVSFKSITD
jgi:ribosomal 50S subunit-recycling heat shock protein